ncbi:hypothetical protein [Halobacillus hunanensis]|nr:hypothetical protein [Halobacillus hunanensis]
MVEGNHLLQIAATLVKRDSRYEVPHKRRIYVALIVLEPIET